MKIPDHVLKKYAQQVADETMYGLDWYNVPFEVRDSLMEASDGGTEYDENYDRLIELLDTAHVGLSWTKGN